MRVVLWYILAQYTRNLSGLDRVYKKCRGPGARCHFPGKLPSRLPWNFWCEHESNVCQPTPVQGSCLSYFPSTIGIRTTRVFGQQGPASGQLLCRRGVRGRSWEKPSHCCWLGRHVLHPEPQPSLLGVLRQILMFGLGGVLQVVDREQFKLLVRYEDQSDEVVSDNWTSQDFLHQMAQTKSVPNTIGRCDSHGSLSQVKGKDGKGKDGKYKSKGGRAWRKVKNSGGGRGSMKETRADSICAILTKWAM